MEDAPQLKRAAEYGCQPRTVLQIKPGQPGCNILPHDASYLANPVPS